MYALYYAELFFKKCTDLNIGYCVELTFLEDKLGRFLMLAFFK